MDETCGDAWSGVFTFLLEGIYKVFTVKIDTSGMSGCIGYAR
jgi:hypothetical protein